MRRSLAHRALLFPLALVVPAVFAGTAAPFLTDGPLNFHPPYYLATWCDYPNGSPYTKYILAEDYEDALAANGFKDVPDAALFTRGSLEGDGDLRGWYVHSNRGKFYFDPNQVYLAGMRLIVHEDWPTVYASCDEVYE